MDMAKPGKGSLGDRIYRQLLKVFGPAQLGKLGTPPERSANRTQGVEGRWVLRRNSEGRTYLASPGDDDSVRKETGSPEDGGPER
jgi:hypothetical protein